MLYPLKFKPIYKERLWGGDNIAKVLGRNTPINIKLIGEAWDIVDRDEDQSILENGKYAGKSIANMREELGTAFLGSSLNPQNPFPLLVKILDAKEDLSLQIHPKKDDLPFLQKEAQVKTEFWYILSTEKNSKIMHGLKNNNRDGFTNNIDKASIKDYINIYDSRVNDLFYIKSGTIHAIGAGNLLLEIQQNSDTTYRLSDWGRFDMHGNPRKLNISEGLICVDFENQNSSKPKNINIEENKEIVNSSVFKSYNNFIKDAMEKTISMLYCEIISVTSGQIQITGNKESIILKYGDSAILPANLTVQIVPYNCKCASFLTTIPVIK